MPSIRTLSSREAAALFDRTGVEPDGEWAVVDFVHYLPATSRGLEDDRFTVEVYRYVTETEVPADGEGYTAGERRCEVHRVYYDTVAR